ncbi:MAG: hypothetical protein DRJ29_02315 [Bacteroidetes bacterium]|nr:MAG: hypothetical protein DRJ29_02315 [Bacteroidota bacterium]
MRQTGIFLLFIVLSFTLNPISIQGQNLDSLLNNKRVYTSVNIGDLPQPKIDGLLGDEIWSLGEWQGDFTQQQPVGNADPTEETYIKVLYDHSNLFVAIICQDDEPDLIRDIFDRRDALSGDMAGIALDSYEDKLTAFEFNLSAAGQKMDLKHLGDYQWDFNWNGVWDGATSKNDTSWVAEMRIPFSQIRYTNREEHVWGMHVWRWIDRRQEEDQWQYIPLDAPAMVYLFGELKGVKNIRESRQVEFLPYVLSSIAKPADGDGYDPLRFNAGLDAKVGISSDYTLDLTINPDFGQVEADPSVLNLTSFETFYEEKRPFFLEGNEIFDFELDGDIPYYSRRIGSAPIFPSTLDAYEISEIPQRTTILGAAKLTGKSSKGLSVGLLNGLTAEEYGVVMDETGQEQEIQVAPLSNYLSTRVKKEFNEGNTIAGGMFSLVNRISPDSAVYALHPTAALTGGMDLLHYWDNKNYFAEAKIVASQLQGSQDAILKKQLGPIHRFQRSDASYLEIDSAREQLGGHGGLIQVGKKGGKINFNLLGQYRSPGLNLNDIGYIRQADFVGERGEVSYRMLEPGDWVREYTLSVQQEARWSFGGENIYNLLGASFMLRTNKLWRYSVAYNYDFSHLDIRELRGGPALRMDGEHQTSAFISSNGSKDFSARMGAHVNWYNVDNSHQEVAYTEITWLPIRKIRLSAIASMNWRKYHQQYVQTLTEDEETIYLVGQIDQKTPSLTFRAELFLNPELSLQYYGSPYFSVGDFDEFKRVDQSTERDMDKRLEALDVTYDEGSSSYNFDYDGTSWNFANPDFSFSQFRSNLVFRWEYHPGSTLYLVWAHDRSDWQGAYNPISHIVGDLFQTGGNNVFMFKLNFWFSL